MVASDEDLRDVLGPNNSSVCDVLAKTRSTGEGSAFARFKGSMAYTLVMCLEPNLPVSILTLGVERVDGTIPSLRKYVFTVGSVV